MSWSRTYTGPAKRVIEQAKADHPKLIESLPEWEAGDVMRVIEAAEKALDGWNPRSEIALSLSGFGHRHQSTGEGGGELLVRINYTVGVAT